MSRQLTLELSDEVYAMLQQQASAAGLSISDWVAISLSQQYAPSRSALPSPDQLNARQRLLQFAGAISFGDATGADNESIDADLARVYANDF